MFDRIWTKFQDAINALNKEPASLSHLSDIETLLDKALDKKHKKKLDISALISFVFSKHLDREGRRKVITIINNMFTYKLVDVASFRLSDLLNMLAYDDIQSQALEVVHSLVVINPEKFTVTEITSLIAYFEKFFKIFEESQYLSDPGYAFAKTISQILSCLSIKNPSVFEFDQIGSLLTNLKVFFEKRQQSEDHYNQIIQSLITILTYLSSHDRQCEIMTDQVYSNNVISLDLLNRIRRVYNIQADFFNNLVPAFDRICPQLRKLSMLLKKRNILEEKVSLAIQDLQKLIAASSPNPQKLLSFTVLEVLMPNEYSPYQRVENLLSIVYELLLRNMLGSDESYRCDFITQSLNNLVTHCSATHTDALVYGIFNHLFKDNHFLCNVEVIEKVILSITTIAFPKLKFLNDDSEQVKKNMYSDIVLILNTLITRHKSFIQQMLTNNIVWLDTCPIRNDESVVSAKDSLLQHLSSNVSNILSKSHATLQDARKLLSEIEEDESKKRRRDEILDSDDESIEDRQPPSPKKSRTPPRTPFGKQPPVEDIDSPSPQKQSLRLRNTVVTSPRLDLVVKPNKRDRQSLPPGAKTLTTSNSALYGNGNRRASSSSVVSNQKRRWR